MTEAPPASRGVTSAALVEAAGITYRQLDYWTRNGHLEPIAGTAGNGHGSRRLFPVEAVYEARLMGQLVAIGFRDLDIAASLARRLVHTARADVPLSSDRHLRITLMNGALSE